jgi:hypothetical protein
MTSLFNSLAEPLTQVAYAAASITASYTNAGNFSSPVEFMIIVSTLDQPVQISFDGTHDHIPVPAGSTTPVFIPVNFKQNRLTFPTPTIFVKRIGTPTTGNLYVSAFTASIP